MRRQLALLGALMISAACMEPSGPHTQLRISGVVTDVSSGAGVPGATVTLENFELFIIPSAPLMSATTDSQGRFSLVWTNDNHCLEIFRLHVTAEGYDDGFTNQISGNNVQCTSKQQILNVQILRLR